ncbi:MAG: sulfotransferase domain-containing protein [Sphingomonadales bacterium]|nr:sulfotransferase domain-containing protein [Sphingomonadales bacterium]
MQAPEGKTFVFIIGAQKAGTTFLAASLARLPDICLCEPKEPQFFTTHFGRGFDYYLGLFPDPAARIWIDASTTYSFLRPRADLDTPDAPGLPDPVPARLKAFAPDCKIIYVLRDPVDRAVSAVVHADRFKGRLGTSLSLMDWLQRDPMAGLPSRYSEQLARYLEVFERNQILVLDFKDLTRNPVETVNRCARFIGVEPVFGAQDLPTEKKHESFRLPGPLMPLVRLTSRETRARLKGWLPRALLRKVMLPASAGKIEVTDRPEADAAFAAERDFMAREFTRNPL